MKRAGEELGFSGRDQVMSLRDLEPGQFYAYGPAISRKVVLAKIGGTETVHPKAGKYGAMKATLPTERIKNLLSKLNDLPREAEQDLNDKVALRKRVFELERQLQFQPKPQPQVDPAVMARKLNEAEIIGFAKADIMFKKRIEDFRKDLQERLHAIQAKAGEIVPPNPYSKHFRPPTEFTSVQRKLPASVEFTLGLSNKPPLDPKPHSWITKQWEQEQLAKAGKPVSLVDNPGGPKNLRVVAENLGEKPLNKCEKAILGFLASRNEPMSKTQIASITGYAPKSGSFNNSLYHLNSLGLITKQGDRISIREGATASVMEILGPDYKAPGRDAIMDWINRLNKCEGKILQVLKEYFPNPMSKVDVAAATNYDADSGSFNNSIYHLCSLGLAIKVATGTISLNPEVANL